MPDPEPLTATCTVPGCDEPVSPRFPEPYCLGHVRLVKRMHRWLFDGDSREVPTEFDADRYWHERGWRPV